MLSSGLSWINALVINLSLSVYESAVTINDKVFSIALSDLVISDITFSLDFILTTILKEVVITANSQLLTFIESEDKVIIDDTTLFADEQDKILNEHIISIAKSEIILDESTIAFSVSATSLSHVNDVFTLEDQRYTVRSDSVDHDLSATVLNKMISLNFSSILMIEQRIIFSQNLERSISSSELDVMIMSAFGKI